jgi:diguanylate cyclase (GGDEF)-like protein/PAS domain S-box-containing protein
VPWYDEEGKIIGTIGITRDITERKKAEEALLKSQQEFVSLFNSSPEALVYEDLDGTILNINPRFTELFGYTLKEIKGRNIDEGMIHPPDKIEEGKKLTRRLEYSNYETIRKKKDGTLFPVLISLSPVIIEEKHQGAIALYQDITERKKAEEALLKSQQEFASLFKNSPEALAYLDEKGNIIDINPRFTELFGYNINEVKGRNLDNGMIHPPEKMEEGKWMTEKALKGKFYYETIRKKKDGTLFPVSISGSRVMLDGKLQGVIGMYRDITERKQDEQLHQVLYNISKAANSAISLGQLYPLIHQELGSIIDTTNFYIALVDEKEDKIFFPYHVDEKDDNFPIRKFNTTNTLTTYVIKTGKPLLNDNNQYKEMIAQGILTPMGTTTDKSIWLGVPLKIEDKVIGAMVVQSYTHPDLYSEKDIKLLEFVSSQVATAIERKRTEEKIRYLSFHDALTDLYNRAYFEEELERYNFPRYYPLSIMMVDINGLKVINDTFGHHKGDKLLQHFASLLNSISRKGDVIARLGGDEFAILLPSTTSQEAHRICERIRKICEEDSIKPIYLRPSIALGDATQKGEYQNAEALLKEADKRMYQDKNITR